MSVLGKLVTLADRVLGTQMALRSKRRYMTVDPSARLENGFRLDLLATPQDRSYVRVGARSAVNAQIIFESPHGSVEIGERVWFGGGRIICRSGVTIGNDVTIAWGVCLYDHDSQSLDWRRRADTVRHFYEEQADPSCYDRIDWTDVKTAPIVIEDRVWIGFDAVILKGVRVGEGAVIGARAVVARDVEPYTVVAGNPARVIKRLERP